MNTRVAWLWAKHHVLLRQVTANTNFVRTNFDSFYHFCISPLPSQLQSVRPCRWYLPLWETVSVSMSEAICPSFPWAGFYFSGKFRTVLCSSPVILYYHRFHEAEYVCARRRMLLLLLLLLLALPSLFQRYLRYRPWSFKPFENNTFSIFETSHDQYNLQVL